MAAESRLQTDAVAFARSYSIISKKLSFGEGWPDYIFIGKGRVLFVEFKAPGESPSPLQNAIILSLRREGIPVLLCKNLEYFKSQLRTFFNLRSYTLGTGPPSC